MSLRIAVQMDPLEGVNPAGDTTFMMIEEAQGRGHTVYVYGVPELSYEAGKVTARTRCGLGPTPAGRLTTASPAARGARRPARGRRAR